MRYYDRTLGQLVYIEERATPDFWDRQWEDEKLKKSILAGGQEHFVYQHTRKYLSPGTKILEGGCGKGQYVYSLNSRGFDAYGVDFADRTVKKVNTLLPELKITFGDVRQLAFPDDTFDGYWSLGVIEHFPEGYTAITKEMYRVLKPGGYLFLTFPYMSPLRKLKAFFGAYPLFDEQSFDRDHFYQFALSADRTVQHFQSTGFELIAKKPYEGFKGLKDESGILKPFFQSIYNNKSLPSQALCYILSFLFAPVSGHAVLLILRKKS